MIPRQLMKQVNPIFPRLVTIRRDFHRHPETAMEEVRTRDKIRALLDTWGIQNRIVAGTGVAGLLMTPGAQKTVALRADTDALPIRDEKTVPYRSRHEGRMHACGHDVHTTVLLGAAKILSDNQETLDRNIAFIFQPGEETCQGAAAMIEAGILDEPRPDAIFALHVNPRIRSGRIGIRYGPYSAASDSLDIRIRGMRRHGARNRILEQLRRLVTALPQALGGTGELIVTTGACVLENDDALINRVRQNVTDLYGADALELETRASMGIEDFAFFLKEIPGAIFSLGTRGTGPNTAFPVHTPCFDADEQAMKTGVAVQVMNALTA